MKTLINSLLLTLVFVFANAFCLSAQTPAKQRMSREQLAEAQAKHIARDLALDDNTAQQFVATYKDFQKDLWAIGGKVNRSKDNADTEQQIMQRFEREQKVLALRQSYYKKYAAFLTPKQIQRVYEIERQMLKRFASRANKAKGQKPRAKAQK